MDKKDKIIDYVTEEIRRGNLLPGTKIPSRALLMRKFGCARATVDKAVGILREKSVLSSVKGKGTFVAKEKEYSRTDAIAVVGREGGVNSLPYFLLHQFLKHTGSSREVRFFTYEDLRDPETWRLCRAQAAIAFIMPDIPWQSYILEAEKGGIPHVVVYRDIPDSSFVSIDNMEGVASLVDYCASKGLKKIALVAQKKGRYNFPEQRLAGYLKGLLRNGLEFKDKNCCFGPGVKVEDMLMEMFAADVPEAVIVSDFLFGPIIKAALFAGLRPEKDFSLLSFDRVEPDEYDFKIPCLASIWEETAAVAVEILERKLAGEKKVIQRYIVPEIYKEST
ncbi:MAG: GntR family transcriptional regulator [Fibrobacterota bacterium]